MKPVKKTCMQHKSGGKVEETLESIADNSYSEQLTLSWDSLISNIFDRTLRIPADFWI